MLKFMFYTIWLMIFFPGICAAGEVNVKRLYKQNWTRIETPNFDVLTNAKENKAIDIVQELENFKYFLSGSLGFEQRDLQEKVPVVVAKNQRTFVSLGIPGKYAGLYISGPYHGIFARGDRFKSASEGGSSYGRSVVFHELVHLFLRNASLEFALPTWFNEGIAEYFGTYIEKKDKVIIGSLNLLEYRFKSLLDADGKFEKVEIESLFKAKQSDLDIGAGRSTTRQLFMEKFYARASAVVHYMYADPRRTKQMYEYLYLLKNGLTVDEAFNHVFKMTYTELDNEVYRYLSRWSLTGLAYRIGKGSVEFPDVGYNKKSISKQEIMSFLYSRITLLSDGFIGDGNHKKLYDDMEELYPGLADTVLQKRLSENPKNPDILSRTARTYAELERYSEAFDLYEKILILDATEAMTLNNYAWLLVTVPDLTLRDPQRAITLAEKSVAIDRKAANLDTLAEAYYAAGSIQKAIETINEAIALEPDNKYMKKQLKKFNAAKK